MDEPTQFSPRAFAFLRALARNNRREWFGDHRAEYERYLRQPLAQLIEEMDVRLAVIAPEITGSPRKSAFRIHRDIRFSRDKSPYKTHVACWFYHRDAGHGVGGEAAHGGAGFYFHMAPDGCFCGGGIWMPPRQALMRIRQRLVDDLEGWEEIVESRGFRRRFGDLDGEHMLIRSPRGYAVNHPALDWLRYTSFTAGRELSAEEVTSSRLPGILTRHYAALVPLVRWLNGALGLPEATRR